MVIHLVTPIAGTPSEPVRVRGSLFLLCSRSSSSLACTSITFSLLSLSLSRLSFFGVPQPLRAATLRGYTRQGKGTPSRQFFYIGVHHAGQDVLWRSSWGSRDPRVFVAGCVGVPQDGGAYTLLCCGVVQVNSTTCTRRTQSAKGCIRIDLASRVGLRPSRPWAGKCGPRYFGKQGNVFEFWTSHDKTQYLTRSI